MPGWAVLSGEACALGGLEAYFDWFLLVMSFSDI
jgi:hypothetical protein